MMSMIETTSTRAAQKLISRQKLLEATIDIIAEEGLAGITLAKVSARAGLSRGLCSFHFDTKEQLMLETFRTLYCDYEMAWRAALEEPGASSQQRLTSLVECLLRPPIADPRTLSVLVAFWGVAPHRQTYLELCAESDRAYEAAIEGILRKLSGGREMVGRMCLRSIAVALTSMIDGAHVQYLIAPGRLSSEEAIQACLAFLSSFFPVFCQSQDGNSCN